MGRPPVVAGPGLQPLRRPCRRPWARRPGRPRLVAGRARLGARCPLRALAGAPRSGLPQQPHRLDVAFVLDLGDGRRGILSVVDTKYHERIERREPKPSRLPRYLEVTERSGVFKPGAIDAVNGTDLLVMWLEHLLVLSMLQHPSGTRRWGRYVVVYPAGNSDFAEACARYADLLVDRSTFSSMTVEGLLDAGALPPPTAAALRDRYIPG
ncbi:MAG TPA: hypothetical protein VGR25_01355 [bacterium]|nr:hypothetical protein [bacterium]